ncbi:MAG: STAS domain-containing protein [Planctomycetaceae bacterium]|jgi:anti-sigma B factor antagonist|nr:STAS domain-containing protein [Planctomycetaceae bacterium]MDG2390322.1 STAS domain-containing protein [Planctomycetaceae bacterium]
MSSGSKALELYQAGPLTVIGFYGRQILEGITPLDCRTELENIISDYHCRTIAFDLTGMRLLPSGMLGLFASVKKTGVDILLYNAGRDVREVLEVTKLDTMLELFEVDVTTG